MTYLTIYQEIFSKLYKSGFSVSEALITLTHRYLDGQPAKKGKKKLNKRDRNAAFWMSPFWADISDEFFATEVFCFALTRYLQQNEVIQNNLLQSVLDRSPSTLCQAVKYSQVFLSPDQKRWQEICNLNMASDNEFTLLLKDCESIQQEQNRFRCGMKMFEDKLEQLSPLDILVYASLYAFKNLIIPLRGQTQPLGGVDAEELEENKEAIEQILLWKLKNSDDESFNLTEQKIAESLKKHMAPFLFPDKTSTSQKLRDEFILKAFEQLVSAHIKLNNYNLTVVDWFCFNEGYNFPDEKPERSQWVQNGKKLKHLHAYWFHRAFDDFVLSGFSKQQFGHSENDEWNRWAYRHRTCSVVCL